MVKYGILILFFSIFSFSSCDLLEQPKTITKKTYTAAELAKRNSEILQEMIRVVLQEEPESPEFFGGLVNTMNQGASVEGIFNGLTHNPHYRGKEETGNLVSERGLDFFIDQMYIFQADALKNVKRSEMIGSLKTSTPFRLKRLLAAEAFKFMRDFPDHDSRAYWYAGWAVEMCKYKIDFGLKQRNLPDLAFHKQWALRMPGDAIDWEVLNRLNRGLNQ
ncbi:MAG: hypothetical protein KA715_11310 [Xanthomonadaceae bacterium]|nr:hypothetical protein [Xanthomonadaceae bacterium]